MAKPGIKSTSEISRRPKNVKSKLSAEKMFIQLPSENWTPEYRNHLKTGQNACPVFEWSTSLDPFMYKEKKCLCEKPTIRKPDMSGIRMVTVIVFSYFWMLFHFSHCLTLIIKFKTSAHILLFLIYYDVIGII